MVYPASLTRSISETVSRAIRQLNLPLLNSEVTNLGEGPGGPSLPPLFESRKNAKRRKLYYVVLLDFLRFTQQIARQFGRSCSSQGNNDNLHTLNDLIPNNFSWQAF